jgi:hypothetical protein
MKFVRPSGAGGQPSAIRASVSRAPAVHLPLFVKTPPGRIFFTVICRLAGINCLRHRISPRADCPICHGRSKFPQSAGVAPSECVTNTTRPSSRTNEREINWLGRKKPPPSHWSAFNPSGELGRRSGEIWNGGDIFIERGVPCEGITLVKDD